MLFFIFCLCFQVEFPFSLPVLRSFLSRARSIQRTFDRYQGLNVEESEERTTICSNLKQFAIDEPIVVAAEWEAS